MQQRHLRGGPTQQPRQPAGFFLRRSETQGHLGRDAGCFGFARTTRDRCGVRGTGGILYAAVLEPDTGGGDLCRIQGIFGGSPLLDHGLSRGVTRSGSGSFGRGSGGECGEVRSVGSVLWYGTELVEVVSVARGGRQRSRQQ